MSVCKRKCLGLATIAGFIFTMLFCLLSVMSCASPQVSDDTNFYFVQITDTHFGDYEHYKRSEKAVRAINDLPMKIECVVHTGDITSEKLDNTDIVTNSIALLGGLDVPVHYIPGNHDILRNNHDTIMQIYTNYYGKLISQQEYNGVIFLFVYTEPLAKDFLVPEYKPLQELEARLKHAGGKPVIIFHHTPSVDDFYNNQMHQGWKNDIREQWVALLNQYNVKAVIAGHFHRDEQHWLGNVPLYVSSSIAGYWGRQATYRIYEYKEGKISYRTQYIW